MADCTENPAEAASVQPINPTGFAVHDFRGLAPSREQFPPPDGKHIIPDAISNQIASDALHLNLFASIFYDLDVLITIFTEFFRNTFGCLAKIASNNPNITILIFSMHLIFALYGHITSSW